MAQSKAYTIESADFAVCDDENEGHVIDPNSRAWNPTSTFEELAEARKVAQGFIAQFEEEYPAQTFLIHEWNVDAEGNLELYQTLSLKEND